MPPHKIDLCMDEARRLHALVKDGQVVGVNGIQVEDQSQGLVMVRHNAEEYLIRQGDKKSKPAKEESNKKSNKKVKDCPVGTEFGPYRLHSKEKSSTFMHHVLQIRNELNGVVKKKGQHRYGDTSGSGSSASYRQYTQEFLNYVDSRTGDSSGSGEGAAAKRSRTGDIDDTELDSSLGPPLDASGSKAVFDPQDASSGGPEPLAAPAPEVSSFNIDDDFDIDDDFKAVIDAVVKEDEEALMELLKQVPDS